MGSGFVGWGSGHAYNSMLSALADFIHRNHFLPAAFKTGDLRVSFQGMFLTDTAVHSFPP